MATPKPTIYPTLVIGLGGTGTEVTRYVKRRFLRTWRADDLDDLPPLLQVLAVDTEPLVNGTSDEPLYFHEFAFLGKFDATRLIQNKKNHSPYLDWWNYGILPGYIHNGAKQLRPVGRLAFFRKYVTFKTLLIDKLDTMKEQAAIDLAAERGFDVAQDHRLIYIVSSLCGGTGAGMFLDVAHRVRQEVGSNANVVGIFLMPSVFQYEIRSDIQRRRIQANAFAALKELNHFHVTPNFSALYPSETTPLPDTNYRAFSQVFLIELTNESGQNLSSKSQSAQMVAHFIHLNAFSHLNKRILGLDVNVTEERANGQAGNGRYLAYSSFATSALVIPRDTLWQFFVARMQSWLCEEMLGQGFEVEKVNTRHDLIVSAIGDEFRRHSGSPKSLDNLEKQIAEKTGQWSYFPSVVWELKGEQDIITSGVSYVFQNYGLDAAVYLLEQLTVSSEAARKKYLAHADTRPFKKPSRDRPSTKTGAGALSRLSSRTDQKSRDELIKEYDLFDKQTKVWTSLVKGIQNVATVWKEQLRQLQNALLEGQSVANSEAEQIARSLDPLRRNSHRESNTYYDLETGAISSTQLDDFWNAVGAVMLEASEDDVEATGITRLDMVLNEFRNLFFSDVDHSFSSAEAGEVLGFAEDLLVSNDSINTIHAAYDMRNVVEIQHGSGHHPPNHRVDQWLQRLSPYAAVDGDTFPHTEANEEHIRLAGTTNSTEDEDNRVFRAAMKGYSEFEWVATGDRDRVDAVHVVHGLPLDRLRSIPDMYKHYMGDEFDRLSLHVDPSWADESVVEPFYRPPVSRTGSQDTRTSANTDSKATTEGRSKKRTDSSTNVRGTANTSDQSSEPGAI